MKRYLFFITIFLAITSCSSDFNGISPSEYIEQNNIDAIELIDGVFIQIHDVGDTTRANTDEVVVFDYRAILANTGETVADEVAQTSLYSNLLVGWQVGLREIGIGGSCTLILHPDHAFGGQELQGVPAFSTMVFDITINEIITATSVDGYIERNELVTTELDQGVHIVIIEPGNDVKPVVNNQIEITYTGRLTNEIVFDQGENAVFNLSNLIEGWKIGLPQIGEGGKCLLIVPPAVAYGDVGAGNGVVPPNAALVFEIELHSVGSAADDYVEENELETVLLPNGVHIIINEPGDQDRKPDLSNVVNVSYEGRLTDGSVFEMNDELSFPLGGVIVGWQVGIQEIGEGGSCTLIIPPAAGYGSVANGDIPANSVLIFDIELHSYN